MMPVHRYKDSYPFQGNQMSSAQNYCPSFEALTPLTQVDPSKTVVINQPWLYPNSFNYSVPCYPCSTDGPFPGYYSHGFYPHSPAPQFHWCGHHPPFPGAFPVQYAPPPYYVKELPRYDYDKPKENGYHCCGCPNHSHNQKYGGCERMEEQEHNMGNKMGHSLVPSQQDNYPYPVLWIPPEYMKNKPLESDGHTQGKSPRDMKPYQHVKPNEQVPKESHSWFPLDMRSLQPLVQGDDARRNQDRQGEVEMRHFPFPIIWMPPHHKQREEEKEEHGKMNGSPTIVKDPVPNNNVFPIKLLTNGHGMNKAEEIEDVNDHSEPKEKYTHQRIIPVKQMEVSKERENSEGAERRGRAVSPKKREDHGTGKSSGASARRDSSSPPKSKLPPVCLRVDPLPRKKNSSVSSRSPSPPGSKGKSQDEAETYQDSEFRESTLSSNKEAEEKKSQGAAIQIAESKRNGEKEEERRNEFKTGFPVCSPVDSGNRKKQQSARNDVEATAEGDKRLESADESTIKQATEKQEMNDASRCVDAAVERDRKKLSVDEAACRIQSAYHGYQVRKWEPLKKLKQIAEVREQMIELRNKIHSLESSLDLQQDEKQTAFIGEMIMRLLLKLDTIQGLHPSLRDVRKSLARELVMLQEKLDLLAKVNCTEKTANNEGGKSREAREHPTDDILHSVNAVSKSQDEETSNPPLAIRDERRETVDDVQLAAKGLESPLNELKEEVDDGELDSSMVLQQNQATHEGSLQLPSQKSGSEEMFGAQLESSCCSLYSEGQSELSDANRSLHKDNSQVSKLEEMDGVISKELVASGEEQMEKVILEGEQNEIDSNVSKLSSSTEIDESDTTAQAVEILNELPVGVIENEGPLEHGLLLDGDMREKAAVDAPEGIPTEDTSLELAEVSDETKQQATLVLNPKPEESCASSANAEVAKENNSEQHFAEGSDKVSSVVGSMDLTKVEIEDNNFPGETMLGGDLQLTQTSESSNIVQTNESLLEETQQASLLLPGKGDGNDVQKEVDQGLINTDMNSILEGENVIVSNVEEAQTGDNLDSVYQPTGEHVDEQVLQDQRESRYEIVNASDIAACQLDMPDSSKEEVLDRAESDPILTEHDESKREALPLLTATDKLSRQGKDISLEDGRKLVEENEKMREMVEKLIQSGKEQLAVISNLTGRMNDLEKKLRRKKMKASRYRTAMPPASRKLSTKSYARKQADSAAV